MSRAKSKAQAELPIPAAPARPRKVSESAGNGGAEHPGAAPVNGSPLSSTEQGRPDAGASPGQKRLKASENRLKPSESGADDKPKMGRPSAYSEEIVNAIITGILDGKSVRGIIRELGLSLSQLHRWKTEYPDFKTQYEEALFIRTDNQLEDMLDIADNKDQNADTFRDRLRIETRKWVAAKMMPAKYGDRVPPPGGGGGSDQTVMAPIIHIHFGPKDRRDVEIEGNRVKVVETHAPMIEAEAVEVAAPAKTTTYEEEGFIGG